MLPLMRAYEKARVKIVAAFVVVALSMLLLCPSALALDPSLDVSQYAHTVWRVRDGFTRGMIWAIAQTQDGYLWLGTDFGLYRFDGVRAVPWQQPTGQDLPSHIVYNLLVARDGALWIGTKNGVASWKDGKLTRYPQIDGQQIWALREDREGTIWSGGAIGTEHGPSTLCAIGRSGVRCYGKDGSLGRGMVGSVYEDRKGDLWAVAGTGIWKWKPGPPKFYPLPIEARPLEGLTEDEGGKLLIGIEGGLRRFLDGKIEAYPLPSTVRPFLTRRLLRDHDGGLWIAAYNAGLVHIHDGRADVFRQADGLSSDDVLALFEDRENNIWASTMSGLERFRAAGVATFSLKEGLSNSLAWSVLADRDGSVWVATPGGLDRGREGQFATYDKHDGKLNGSAPTSLFQDSGGRIWVSTHRQFGYLERNRFVSVGRAGVDATDSIGEDSAGDLWIADQQKGLFQLRDNKLVKPIPWIGLGHKDFALSLAADPLRGGIWLGFYEGGISRFAGGRVQETYTAADGLANGSVSNLHVERDGTLWAATDGGLTRMKNGHFATLSRMNGLPCDAIHWMIQGDDHSFWLYTPCGLLRLAPSEMDAWSLAVDRGQAAKQMVHPDVFDVSDGVIVRETTSDGPGTPVAKSLDGRIWFLPLNGLSVIDPRHLPFNKIPPPVQIERITANGETYDASNGLRLPPRIRDLKIDYTALSFVVPEKVRFRYKLEGQDRNWREVANDREVQYSNLPPGDYVFRVTAANNSGVWNETGAFLDFSIAPAYSQTKWFRALCVAAFLGLFLGAYQLRVRQLRNEEKKFREAVETMPALAFTAMPDGQRTFVNGRWVEYTGLTEEQASGFGWQAAIHPDDLSRVLKTWQESLIGGRALEYEARLRHGKEGDYRWFQTRAVPVHDKWGKIGKWYGVINDIEDRKRAEQLQADLAHVNRVNTLGELTTSLAHDIKQPIGAAVTNAEACARFLDRDQPDVAEAREAALEMARDAKHAAQIIDRVRSLYRKDSSHLDIVDVNEIIEEMDLLLRSESHRHAVSLRTDLADELPKITADRVQLQQVVMNLMLNGIESMRENGGELIIKSQLREDGKLQISVTDSGVGLPPEKADQIFNAFFTTKPQGTGLGLSITRSIVESHGGRVWAAANSERGTTFHFTLPIRTVVPA
jgi:PAS domain S-box-containing protein